MSRARTWRSNIAGGGPIRSTAGTGGRPGPPPRGGDRQRSAPALQRWRRRQRPRPSRSSSTSAATRSRLGLVASLSRPGGNVTGMTNLNVELGAETAAVAPRVGARGVPCSACSSTRPIPMQCRIDHCRPAGGGAARSGLQLDALTPAPMRRYRSGLRQLCRNSA